MKLISDATFWVCFCVAFRCAYCFFLNPARKTRPQAPRLPDFSFERKQSTESRSETELLEPKETKPLETQQTEGIQKSHEVFLFKSNEILPVI